MPPYTTYLVYGYILSSSGTVVSNAKIIVNTSISSREYFSNSSGIYMYDLAEIGYVDGETVIENVTEPYNNEYKEHTFVVSGSSNEEDITLSVRTIAVNATDYSPKTILHSVGKEPITKNNPLPISGMNSLITENFDYVDITYDSDDQPITMVYKSGGASGTTVATITITYTANGCTETITKA